MQVDDQDETYEEEDKDNVSALKTENQLLRELNAELKHKILLLNEMLTKEKERPSTYKETYAGIISENFVFLPFIYSKCSTAFVTETKII